MFIAREARHSALRRRAMFIAREARHSALRRRAMCSLKWRHLYCPLRLQIDMALLTEGERCRRSVL